MSIRAICKFLEKYLLYFACVLLLPLGVAILYDYAIEKPYFSTPATVAFLQTIAICVALSFIANFIGRKQPKRNLERKEGIVLVVLIWLITVTLGALPFQFTGRIANPIDAYFESMSGLTTTGASILQAKAYDAQGAEIPITMGNPIDASVSYTFYGTIAPLRDPDTQAVLHTGIEALENLFYFGDLFCSGWGESGSSFFSSVCSQLWG